MRARRNRRRERIRHTQLRTIRELMLAARRQGAWLTLGEIARLTEIGEATVSAQLRHLRTRRHGRHVVEKRRRMRAAAAKSASGRRHVRTVRFAAEPVRWEYRVLPRR